MSIRFARSLRGISSEIEARDAGLARVWVMGSDGAVQIVYRRELARTGDSPLAMTERTLYLMRGIDASGAGAYTAISQVPSSTAPAKSSLLRRKR